MGVYTILGLGLSIVIGQAGLLDLGYIAFYAIGAYWTALLSTHFGVSFWILLPTERGAGRRCSGSSSAIRRSGFAATTWRS